MNTTINIPNAVAPGYIRVNSSQNYTFTGAGSITTGTLRKDGTGTLTLATTNTYAGLTSITQGTVLLSKTAGVNAIIGDGLSSKSTALAPAKTRCVLGHWNFQKPAQLHWLCPCLHSACQDFSGLPPESST